MLIKTAIALTLILSLLTGIGSSQAALMQYLLPGRWLLYAGGGAEIWDFREDGTCTSTGITFDGV